MVSHYSSTGSTQQTECVRRVTGCNQVNYVHLQSKFRVGRNKTWPSDSLRVSWIYNTPIPSLKTSTVDEIDLNQKKTISVGEKRTHEGMLQYNWTLNINCVRDINDPKYGQEKKFSTYVILRQMWMN